MSRDTMENYGTKISYTIFLGDKDFHATQDEGEYLQVGMNIATVLEKNTPIIVYNKESKKYLGLTKPYFILMILITISIPFILKSTSVIPEDKKIVTQVVISIFLILAAILNLITYLKTAKAIKFLKENLK